jgi:opacity protein-like surface antigen
LCQGWFDSQKQTSTLRKAIPDRNSNHAPLTRVQAGVAGDRSGDAAAQSKSEAIMRIRWIFTTFFLGAVTLLGRVPALAQTDVAASLYGAFSGTTNGNGTVQSPANAAGALIEVRHLTNPILGFEGTYSYNRANQTYTTTEFACPVGLVPCTAPTESVSADAHELTADWIPHVKVGSFRPFGVLGVGALFDVPESGADTRTTTKAVFVYGAGLDWGLLPHLGVRLQYRGNLYKAPDLSTLYTSTDAFTHTAEPMIGVYLRL